MGFGIDVWVDAQCDGRTRARSACGRVESLKLGWRFDVELPHSGRERQIHLVSRLARSGKHQTIWRDTGPERAAQLAA